ncbi:MAG: CAP domain-containing protein [Burkholderiales bacterium]
MRARIFLSVLMLAVSFDAAARTLYSEINRLRAGDRACAVARNLPPLQPQPALERVARDLARGGPLEQSLQAAGYQATGAAVLNVRGDFLREPAEAALARQNACDRLQNGALTEIGVYIDSRQFWIVMAAPQSSRGAPAKYSAAVPPYPPRHAAPRVGVSGLAVGYRILDLINAARARPRYCGNEQFAAAPPVRWNESLAESSQRHSDDMANHNFFDHVNPRDGTHSWDRVERAGYQYSTTGENIGAGYKSAETVVDGWIKSAGHCANLMNPDFTEMGAAMATNRRSKMGLYWTQEFGAPLLSAASSN